MKIYNGQVIGAKNKTEESAVKKELLSKSLPVRQKKSKEDDVEPADDNSVDAMNERANALQLLVTPEVLAVAAGQKMSLRVRANCRWHIVSLPANASAAPGTVQFGDGSIDVLAPSEVALDGTLVVASEDGSVEAVVTVVPAYPEAPQTDVRAPAEESVAEATEAATNE